MATNALFASRLLRHSSASVVGSRLCSAAAAAATPLVEETRTPAQQFTSVLTRNCFGSARAFSSKAAGNGILGMDLCTTNSHLSMMEEKEHPSLSGRDFDGVASVSGSHLNEGNGFIKRVPFQPSTALWAPLPCACRAHNQMGMARRAAVSRGHGLGPLNSTGSVILSNNYASNSRFEDKAKIRALMESRGLKKEPGWSRIEIQGQLNTFLVDDQSHPRNKEIRVELQRMLELMKEAGYVADLRCVLRDIPESEKEYALQHHSERLAMALGHISLPPRAPLRIIKNLRVCNDCHVATKYFAKIMQREIIVRDATRFHHFREGYCSCGDYW